MRRFFPNINTNEFKALLEEVRFSTKEYNYGPDRPNERVSRLFCQEDFHAILWAAQKKQQPIR